ncbi:MAG: MotA/TolQ/ExbB proton channel family protein, partial [Planctomycetia bacterium]
TLTAVFNAPARAQDEKTEAKAAPAAAADAGEADAPKSTNFLYYCYEASPAFFIIMSALSVYLGTIVYGQFVTLRLPRLVPPQLVGTLDVMLNEKKFKEGYEVLRGDKSVFGRALTSGVEKLSHGFERALEAMLGVADEEKMKLEQSVSMIGLIAQVAPMLGLLGTVLGMIMSFQEIAKGGQPKPAELANNIGLALVSTLEGLVVAIPALYFYALFRNRIARLALETESVCETFLFRFGQALKK